MFIRPYFKYILEFLLYNISKDLLFYMDKICDIFAQIKKDTDILSFFSGIITY